MNLELEKIVNINLKDYSYESCPMESSAGGTVLCISNHLSHKPRSNLCIDRSSRLESTFIDILNPTNPNVILGCMYHSQMELNKFNDYYIDNLLDKLSNKYKIAFL